MLNSLLSNIVYRKSQPTAEVALEVKLRHKDTVLQGLSVHIPLKSPVNLSSSMIKVLSGTKI